MNLKTLKTLQAVVGVCVLGVLVAFVMAIVTAVKSHHAETSINPATIPTPAIAPATH